ncbi:Transketolase [Coccidioides posadasii str. Silveira]|uniref:Transketolase n=3 Tax=Coccidioides posadasii TaxID=199306 RepID=E9CYJ8_COCPS|nr:transketolase TktA, putative [Coccidioides posadasii C735 delta SOWgp]EER27073.1 transketolase TktA, putative [Coccidioides posadasii C735 delta SOWgp]EFW21025.1 transketolase TktA [Coccidioides posadasii str. Silveira]KMM66761.1 transketolase [Coccidioides posadasii RMSCC 3488]QVM08012.1 Transketolase [Coccidioides posadasii str. Silveira]|eukprot:XP_003069218.1 transketolase TktA, putative [Coccidioides posadasii C735 delta SOWgp]
MGYTDLDRLAINTIRVLAVDATSKANSGHPGAPMGLAPTAHVLFNKFMSFNPKNPQWINRDRFVLSNGHGCMLQYALLHLFGYEVSLDDLKNFRQVDSITPGHPEAHDTPGVEVTTGPLGQGFANAVGLAIAQKHTAAVFNKPGYDLINNYTYCIFGDGCAMEGVASEAASQAGHLQLGNLICLYDDNHISIDGDTKIAFTEDVMKRFESYGWHTLHVKDGDHDLDAIEAAIEEAKKVTDKPTVIKVTTTIGFGSKLQGTGGVHGNPLKADDAQNVKKIFGFNPEQSFVVPQEVYDLYHKHSAEGAAKEQEWNILFQKYKSEYPELHADFTRRLTGKLPEGWEKNLPTYKPSDPPVASRKLSEAVLERIHDAVPELLSGSADLTGSNNTRWKNANDFQPPSLGIGDWAGRYLRYGVREHGMAAIMNGIAAYGTLIPAAGTFLNFVSYAAGAVRLSSLSQVRVIYIATHDSIGLGEDGPTHQPIETLAHFRALPNMMVWRPADGNETSAAYYSALTSKSTPSILALTRQNLPHLESSSIEKALKGGYVALEAENADITVVSTGSEVSLCIDAAKYLKEKHNITARVVSIPCFEIFDVQPKEYRLQVIPDGIPSLSVEVMSTMGWERYSHEQFGLNRFGASAPYKEVYKKFEFTPEGISKRALATIDFYKGYKVRSPINRAFKQII